VKQVEQQNHKKNPKIHVADASTRGDRRWPWRLSACPSYGSQRERDRRADAWAIDALRQRLSSRVSWTGECASDRCSGVSVGRSPDASVGLKTVTGHFWTASVAATDAEGKTDRRVRRWWRWPLKFEARGHVAWSCAIDAGTTSVGGATGASVAYA
jgi:hypothetical protein